MKKLLILVFGLFLLISISFVNASAAASAERNRNIITQQSGGCMPPLNFSLENNCKLEYTRDYSVAKYYCYGKEENYIIYGDCLGGTTKVTSWKYPNQSQPFGLEGWIISASIIILFLILIIYFMRRKR